MTALYYDTNVGCTETYTKWTAADEKQTGFMDIVMDLFC